MGKYGLRFVFHVTVVYLLIAKLHAVPARVRRQDPDLVQLHDGILLQDYDDGDINVDDIRDDNSQLSPHDESEADNTHQFIDDHDVHGNGSANTDDAGLVHEPDADRLVHDLDIHGSENGDEQGLIAVDHSLSGDGLFDGAARTAHVDTDGHEIEQINPQTQGPVTRSRQHSVWPTFGIHSHLENSSTTRGTNNSNVQGLAIHHFNGTINKVNVSTNGEHETHHGFLTVDNLVDIENERALMNNNTLTSRSSTLQHSTTRPTPGQFITVKVLNVSNQEHTESLIQEPNSGVIITQTNEGHVDSGQEPINEREHSHENGIEATTETSEPRDHHVTVLAREPNVQGADHSEHTDSHEGSEPHQTGIDVSIDKGDNPHNNTREEHGPQGPPRHTNNPVLQTPTREGNFPEVEPTVTTPRLIIIPTPAQAEPQDRNTSAENVEPQATASRPSTDNEQTELPGENGEGHIHSGNYSRESQVTPGEGQIEFITEEPEHGENENKPNKNDTKEAGEKSNMTQSMSVSPDVINSEVFATYALTSEILAASYELELSETTDYEITSVDNLQSSIQSRNYNTENAGLTPSFTPSLCIYGGCSSSVEQASTFRETSSSELPPERTVYPNVLQSSAPIVLATSSFATISNSRTQPGFPPSGSEEYTKTKTMSIGHIVSSQSLALVSIEPSESSSHLKEINEELFSSSHVPGTTLTPSDISTTRFTDEKVYSATSSLQVASTQLLQSAHVTEGYSSRAFTPAAMITHASVSVPVTSNVTTKKKSGQNTTTLASTIAATRKKPDSGKGPEKPENQSSTTSTSTGASTPTATVSTTGSFTSPWPFPATLLSYVPVTFFTQKPEITTPPSVYIEIQLRMDWSQFCVSRPHFISEIKRIMLTEKGFLVEEEQFKTNTGNCGDANSIMEGRQITVEMYIVDNDGKLDISLTTVTSYVISKGFQQSNYLKDKIVYVHTVGRRQPSETVPGPRAETRKAPPAVTMVIVIASVGGVCCVALIILQVLIHRRIKTKRKQRAAFVGHRASLQSMDHVALGVIPKSRPNSGYWNPALDDTFELPEPEKHSHIMNFSSLANFCMDTKGIHAEFQTIPFDDVDVTAVPVGEEDKNRFANVLPNKQTRVSLKKTQDNQSEYINANYVNGYMEQKRVYIATQSPLVNTVEDFWRMVWEQQSRSILMLNPVTQHGKPKQSTCYWPDNLKTDCRREFGDYVVTLKKKDVQKDYIDCTLEIMDIERNLKRELHHFWFTCWSDTGPPEPLTLVKFVLDTRPHFENGGSPVIVHCGPGTGRSGVYIAVDMCMRMFEDRRRVDIQNCVHKMRSERAGTVQTKEQYNLIYQALNEYAVILSSPSISTRSSVITLHAML